ncbi:mitochondrial outer membrane translocase complex, subunit Tom22 [Xylariomycetidae sp. FL0641]|nr:mitochondrial outer membrane translocase complex, subunit Tom22 [Xylariomycetidae sp. FL0641]
MVQLHEIVDEHFQEGQAGPEEDDADYTDTDSDISDDSDFNPDDESLWDRIYALRNMIPPRVRYSVYDKVRSTSNAVRTVLSFSGKTAWVISSSALLIGVPFALAVSEEQQFLDMEREMNMRQQGGDLLTAGANGQENAPNAQQADAIMGMGASEAKPAL